MISLNLHRILRWPLKLGPQPDDRIINIEAVEEQFRHAFSDLGILRDQQRRRTVIVPSDLLFQAVDVLLPAERMAVIAGRRIGDRVILGTMYDVTGVARRTHVRADPGKLRQALITFEKAGVELMGWAHSHPGTGPASTAPSPTDWEQYADWARHYGEALIGIIVVADGFVRLWGDGVDQQCVVADVVGAGVCRAGGHRHVYKLAR